MLPIPLSTVNGMPELLLPKDVMDLCTLSCLVSLMTNVCHGCPGLEMLPCPWNTMKSNTYTSYTNTSHLKKTGELTFRWGIKIWGMGKVSGC